MAATPRGRRHDARAPAPLRGPTPFSTPPFRLLAAVPERTSRSGILPRARLVRPTPRSPLGLRIVGEDSAQGPADAELPPTPRAGWRWCSSQHLAPESATDAAARGPEASLRQDHRHLYLPPRQRATARGAYATARDCSLHTSLRNHCRATQTGRLRSWAGTSGGCHCDRREPSSRQEHVPAESPSAPSAQDPGRLDLHP
mmetsp:Transcript_1490/g.6515  ORF Transcript_1490/g.6515 Transcript_1490/m.6515 type:complete len:200 (+) Transcript_1490:2818-3417(+)